MSYMNCQNATVAAFALIYFHFIVWIFVQVFYLDYGTVDEVFVDEIRLMRKDYAELLPQAFRGCLENIRPSGGLWTRQATQTFKSAVENINVYANVTAIDTEVR